MVRVLLIVVVPTVTYSFVFQRHLDSGGFLSHLLQSYFVLLTKSIYLSSTDVFSLCIFFFKNSMQSVRIFILVASVDTGTFGT